MKNGDSYVMADMASAMPMTVRQSFVGSAKHVLLGTILNVLLICVPLALLSEHFQVGNEKRGCDKSIINLQDVLGQSRFDPARNTILKVDGKQHWILTHTPVCSECKSSHI